MYRHGGVHYNASDALKFAVMYDHIPYAKYLLDNFLDEALDRNLCCPVLLLAVQHGCKEMVHLLCSYSNNAGVLHKGRPYIDACGCEAMENKKSPLHISAELGLVDITKVLLQHGADTSVLDRGGLTPLCRTVQQLLNVSMTSQAFQGLWSSQQQQQQQQQQQLASTVQRLPARTHSAPRTSRSTTPTSSNRSTSRSRSPVLNQRRNSFASSRMHSNAFSCMEELLKCERSISASLKQQLAQVYLSRDESLEDVAAMAPFSLLHHARLAVRTSMGKPRLPHGIAELGLPRALQEFVNLNAISLQVIL